MYVFKTCVFTCIKQAQRVKAEMVTPRMTARDPATLNAEEKS